MLLRTVTPESCTCIRPEANPCQKGRVAKTRAGPVRQQDPPPNSVPKRRLFVAAPRRLVVYVDLFLSDVLFDDLFVLSEAGSHNPDLDR